MLIRFSVENFRSIREEQEISLVASTLSEHPETLVPAGGYRFELLRAAAVYGPNASGKSALFHALSFMRAAVTESHRMWAPDGGVPRTPFALDADSRFEPSTFEVDVLIGGIRYEYGFTVDSERVHEEWLYAYPRGKRQEWFTRDASRDMEFTFNRALPGENRSIGLLTRPNSLFLSAAAQNNHTLLLPIYMWFVQSLWIVDDSTRSYFERYTVEQCRAETYRNSLSAQLAAADLGINGIEFNEDDTANEQQALYDPVRLPALRGKRVAQAPSVRLSHSTDHDPGVGVALPFEQESRGTRTLFALLGILNWCLGTGGTVVVDELDQSLHSQLASRIVGLFISPDTNPNAAQLLFNTHDTNLLSEDLLRRDQVWFTEKTGEGATRLFPLTDFRARKHENLERGYLQGRYGAIPSLADALGAGQG